MGDNYNNQVSNLKLKATCICSQIFKMYITKPETFFKTFKYCGQDKSDETINLFSFLHLYSSICWW